MNLTFEEFKEFLTQFLAIRKEQRAWEDRLPEDLGSLFDNTYVNGLGNQLDLAHSYLFGMYYDDVSWFLYEMPNLNTPEGETNVEIKDRKYRIVDLESYLDYAKKEINFKEQKKMALISRNRLGVINNRYQGEHLRVLTVCSAGCLRSPTAAHILSSEPWNFNTRCAGLSEEYAIVPVTYALVQWADEIVVMDTDMFQQIMGMQHRLAADMENSMHEYEYRPVHVLNIEDDYAYRDPRLVELMIERFNEIYAVSSTG